MDLSQQPMVDIFDGGGGVVEGLFFKCRVGCLDCGKLLLWFMTIKMYGVKLNGIFEEIF